MSRRRQVDPARLVAFRVLRRIGDQDAYANLALAAEGAGLETRDAAFATELTFGSCRALGSYDAILERAAGRPVAGLDPAVLDVLRLGTHQLLAMRVPSHAAVATSVDLAATQIGERVAGLVNAVLRKVAARDWDGWLAELSAGLDDLDVLALATQHPRWIVEAWRDALGDRSPDELRAALEADNVAPVNHLVVRPGLASVAELGGTPTRYSPYGAAVPGAPGSIPAVAEGRAGVQDEGSQLVALALSRVEAPSGLWLDLCAGPGGKAALLAGLAIEQGSRLVASELQPHRAGLVAANLACYDGDHEPVTVVADGTRPAWPPASFARVMADVPCTGLGALRRRPESRWRRQPSDLADLVPLQRRLLDSAIAATRPGGVIAYVTCSPQLAETREVVAARAAGAELLRAADYLPEVADAAVDDFVQLWPHRHGTDAMFLALLRRTAA
ncbi:MAG: transcription antitermination factor NusB [Propionicimonas sp.]|uniref:RsmB/NOP family class I SAM-dependent RNA methyltransferase n=1 Tax=Propionicimonas sp. TaxID=1955623 RepID=UPI002B20A793|nr:transcription antitermination factor NusB [Propionicimonas sp.]MEA4943134.1 transcription antitermination factor NusB [Propionicimonas sp.]